MQKNYSIIIPIHNEIKSIPILLESLKTFKENNNEILIIDDGSTDGSTSLLKASDYINLIVVDKNSGKGYAVKEGLKKARYNKIIIFDGDMELKISDISKLMILHRENGICCVMGYRFNSLRLIRSNFDWGNFLFTAFFNIIFKANHKDILCCAKSFYIDDIKNYKLLSNGFDIDIELSTILTIKNKNIPHIYLQYKRRTMKEGKKLQLSDGWIILARILKMISYY